MCGRFIQIANPERIRVKLSEIEIPDRVAASFTPRYNIAPTQEILTVLNNPAPRLGYTRWGLVPSWAKDVSMGSRMINARAETLQEKPAYRTPFKKQRCIIFTDGFYEWKGAGKSKTPYFIRLADHEPFALAGLWDLWEDRRTGPTLLTSTIITTSPNDLVKEIHDRMPVILAEKDYMTWLDPAASGGEALMACLNPYPSDAMEAYEVSALVNNPGNDTPDCILPRSLHTGSTGRLFQDS